MGPLKLNLEKGSSHTLKSETDIQYFSDASLSENVMSMKMEMVMDYKVIDKVGDSIQTIEASISKLKLDQSMSGMSISYDSDDPSSTEGMGAMIAEQFSPILNQRTTFQLNAKGDFVDKPDSAEMADEGMTPLAFMRQAFLELPTGDVKVGETWTQEVDAPGSPVAVQTKYTVQSADKNQVVYAYSINDLDLGEIDGALEDTETKTEGTLTYDRKTGKLLSNQTNSTLKGSNPQMGEFFMVTTSKVNAIN